MPEKILASFQTMKDSAGSIRQAASSYRDEVKSFYKTADEIMQDWSGTDYDAFRRRVGDFSDDFEHLAELMEAYAKYLEDSATAYETAQNEIASQARNLQG